MHCRDTRIVWTSLLLMCLTLTTATAAHSLDTPQKASRMPLAFTKNAGQWDEQVLFRADACGTTIWFTKEGFTCQFSRRIDRPRAASRTSPGLERPGESINPDSLEQLVIIARFVGANPSPEVIAEDEMEYKCNYFFGSDPAKWYTDVPNYEAVTLRNLYPGVDLKYSGDADGQVAYEFITTSSADVELIKIEYEGAEGTSVDGEGRLILKTAWGEMRVGVLPPAGDLLSGEVGFGLKSGTTSESEVDPSTGLSAGFSGQNALAASDIGVSYSTYLGGAGDDYGWGIAVDAAGCAYVIGNTTSAAFPTLNPYQGTNQGGTDIFVTKLSSSGNSLIYSTYLGGGDTDEATGIALDGNDNVYVTGRTVSSNFPTSNPYQSMNGGGTWDALITKLSNGGNSLVYSTYLGGGDRDEGNAVVVDSAGRAFVVGSTNSSNFPTVNQYQTEQPYMDVFVTKFSSSGSSLAYSTYLGGSGDDYGTKIAVDNSGSAYVTGYTYSVNFPTQNPYQTDQGGIDVFVSKLSSTGSSLDYGTYLGGGADDYAWGIARGTDGCAYITGYTSSSNFPTVNSYQTDQAGVDAFVTKLASTGGSLTYSTYLGGSGDDWGYRVAVDNYGNTFIVGRTASTDFPLLNTLQTNQPGDDVFITKLTDLGNSLDWSTYLGGSGAEIGLGIALHSSEVYVTGSTWSPDFPTVDPYLTDQSGTDAFVAKLNPFRCGDVNGDGGSPDLPDLTYLYFYLFANGQAPVPLAAGNADGECMVNVADAVYLRDYLFDAGPAPFGCPAPSACLYGTLAGNQIRQGCRPYSGPSDSLSVPIYISNSVGLKGMSIGFCLPSNDIEILGVDFGGSIIPGTWNTTPLLKPAQKKVLVGSLLGTSGSAIAPQVDGLLCKLIIRIISGDPDQYIDLDSAFVGPGGEFMFVTTNGNIRPEFVKCDAGFQILPSPDTADVFYVRQADVDGDNNADVIFTGDTSDSLYIAYGKPDGTLETSRGYLRANKAALAVDFINDDSLLDIVARTTGKVYVLLNSGSRSFAIDSQAVGFYDFGGEAERSSTFPSVATGYVDGDVYVDALVSENKVLFGNGNGGFPTSATLPFSFDAVAVSDFDRSGTDDIVITAGDSAFIYLNDGSANLTRSSALRIGYLSHDFTNIVGGIDFNRDGKTDFVVVTGNTVGTNDTSVVTTALGDGFGGVASTDTLRIVGTALNLALADVDKDRDLDINLVNTTTRSLLVVNNDGIGNFTPPASIPLGSETNPLYTLVNADLDRNGAPDFVIGGAEGNPILLAISEIPDDPILADEMVTTGYNYVTLRVENPLGLVISRPLSTVAGSAYWRVDADHNGVLDESAYDYNLQHGEYRIVLSCRTNLPVNPYFSAGIRIDGTAECVIFHGYEVPAAGDSLVFYYQVEPASSIYPANGRPTANPQPTFSWSGLASRALAADSYEFQLDRYYDFRSPIFSVTGLTSPQYRIPSALNGDSVYYWRIRPVTGGIPGAYTRTFAAYLLSYLCGDANSDGTVNISDAVFLIAYIFAGGSAPDPLAAGDANRNGAVNISDAVYLIAYIFAGGPAPCFAP